MKRYLFILNNRRGYRPGDRARLLNTLRGYVRAANVRIASRHVEVEVWDPDLPAALSILGSTIGEVILWKLLDESAPPTHQGGELGALEEFAHLFNEERFWEAHGVLEGAWRSSGSEVLRGLILVAASFVKIQEGKPGEFEIIARRALEALSRYSRYMCIDIESIRKALDEALRTREPFKISCER